MFDSVLVANRGEVAVRVIRACHDLGIRAIAIASDADEGALHTRLADDVVRLGGSSPAESYLNVDAVTRAIVDSGAQAVHPGYGFLSESAEFADVVSNAGATYIGPSAAAIAQMGSKISARRVAANAGVASVPGLTAEVTTEQQVEEFGAQYGYPIAIKASFGGGGRGMRVVRAPADIGSALDASRREALAYFGNDQVYLEKYLEHPRHIEMQIIGDQHGHVVWLGERDCSVQRRHQKLVEETPALGFDPATRQSMGEAAVAIAHEVGYSNAGTIEFLYEKGEFWFLEMNTRLQVEHPVTEMVTGIDIVAEQIRVAAGEKLSFTQEDVRTVGHSIEMRINAEDPSEGRFSPTPGTVSLFEPPAGEGLRFDGGYETGDIVSQFYDSLLGKLIVWANTREESIDKALNALEAFKIDGVSSTIPAHKMILEHADFRAGTHDTKWLEEVIEFPDFAAAGSPSEQSDSENVDRSMVWINNRLHWIPSFSSGPANTPQSSAAPTTGGGPLRKRVQVEGSGPVTAPLQGTVVAVRVANGDVVAIGDVVCVLEAMKMENEIKANRSGTVTELAVEVGASVGPGAAILTIQ